MDGASLEKDQGQAYGSEGGAIEYDVAINVPGGVYRAELVVWWLQADVHSAYMVGLGLAKAARPPQKNIPLPWAIDPETQRAWKIDRH